MRRNNPGTTCGSWPSTEGQNDNGVECDTLKALVNRNSFTKSQELLEVEEMEVEMSLEELEERMRKALKSTSNRSTPGSDGISYRFIKMVLNTKLGKELVKEIAVSLKEGRIPEEWQRSKVVSIPKPNKDHRAAKGWRPINLINCISKLAEKVATDELQEAGLFHKGQYGGVKGRSALEARAQRALAWGG